MLITDNDYGSDQPPQFPDDGGYDFTAFRSYIANDPGYEKARPAKQNGLMKTFLGVGLVATLAAGAYHFDEDVKETADRLWSKFQNKSCTLLHQAQTTLMKRTVP